MTKVYKTVLIGEGGVGKTSIAVRYTEDRFDEQMKMTIGVNFATKKLTVGDTNMTLMLWDLGGQPRFQDVVVDYFRGSRVAIAVYDATRTVTLHQLNSWIEKVQKSAPDCRIFFAGNKTDERDDGFGVSISEAKEFANKFSSPVFEMSAKTGTGIHELFQAIAEYLIDQN